jgi:general secretion pathway protein A
MYKRFFNLQTDPFTINPDPRFLYKMPQTLEALASLQYGITSKRGFMVLTGEVGTGKTTLLRHTLDALHRTRIHSSFVFNPRLEVVEFLEFILSDFGLPPTTRTKSGMLIQLNRWLIERFGQKELCVIVIDEAQNLTGEMLEEIRLLTNLETSSEKLVQIILSGQPELEARLRQPDVRQLRQRISLWCRTQPLNLEQTEQYILTRLKIAGRTEPIFTPESIKLIHKASTGIPRLINQICENCLIFAYVDQSEKVLPKLVSLVVDDLRLQEPEESRPPLRGSVSAT